MGAATVWYEAAHSLAPNPGPSTMPDGSAARFFVHCVNHSGIVAGPFSTNAAAAAAAVTHMQTASVPGGAACNIYGTSDSVFTGNSHA